MSPVMFDWGTVEMPVLPGLHSWLQLQDRLAKFNTIGGVDKGGG
jgi:hypothetical protein